MSQTQHKLLTLISIIYIHSTKFESKIYMYIRRCVGYGDAYPSNWPAKLEKGDYTLKAHIRQEKKELLDR